MASKVVPIIVGVVVVAGLVVGLGVAGVVNIPGLTHAKPKKKSSKELAKEAAEKKAADDKAAAEEAQKKKDAEIAQKKADQEAEKKKELAAQPKYDNSKGYAKLAAVWANLTPDKILLLLKTHYKPDDAAPILKLMDESLVASVLALMEPKDAAAYSESLAKEVSRLPSGPSAS